MNVPLKFVKCLNPKSCNQGEISNKKTSHVLNTHVFYNWSKILSRDWLNNIF